VTARTTRHQVHHSTNELVTNRGLPFDGQILVRRQRLRHGELGHVTRVTRATNPRSPSALDASLTHPLRTVRSMAATASPRPTRPPIQAARKTFDYLEKYGSIYDTERGQLHLSLSDETVGCIVDMSRLWGVSMEATIQRVIREHLDDLERLDRVDTPEPEGGS
jgi:hypothetical protein